MEIDNPQTFDHIKSASGEILRCKIMDIGDWNMYLSTQVDIDIGIHFNRVIGVWIKIRGDATGSFPNGRYYTQQNSLDPELSVWAGHLNSKGNTIMTLLASATGGFHSHDFEQTSYNRGYVCIWYTDASHE